MSFENDDLLEALMQGEKPSSSPETELMQNLVHHYQAKPLSSRVKESIWQEAQAKQKHIPRKKAYFSWKGRLVAGLVFMIACLMLINLRLNEGNMAALQEETLATEVVLQDMPALFSDVPEISTAFGFEYGGYANPDNLQAMGSMMRDAQMQWLAIYEFQDTARLPLIQEQIETAHRNGFKILVSVSGPLGSSQTDTEVFASSYANFVGQIAYAGADAIEIWPEANLDRDMPQDFLGADTYARILAESSTAIRSSNPNTLVISGAPAPTGAEAAYPEQVINDDNFLRQLMDMEALNTVDCIGLHYNEGIVPPLSISGDSRGDYYTRYLPTQLQHYREIVQARIPICVTSIGYFSTEGLDEIPQYFSWGAETSRAEQEQWLSDAMEWLSLQTDVRLGIIWHIDYQYEQHRGSDADNNSIYQGFSLVFPSDD